MSLGSSASVEIQAAISSAIPESSRLPTVHNAVLQTTPSGLASLAWTACTLGPIGYKNARTVWAQESACEDGTIKTRPAMLHLVAALCGCADPFTLLTGVTQPS